MNPEINARKIAIVGCGMVGATSAFALMEQGLFSELVLSSEPGTGGRGSHGYRSRHDLCVPYEHLRWRL